MNHIGIGSIRLAKTAAGLITKTLADLIAMTVAGLIAKSAAGLIAMLALLSGGNALGQSYDVSLLNKGAFYAVSSILVDVDEDGDPDVVVVRRQAQGVSPGIEWMENDGTGQFPRHELFEDDTLERPEDVDACDCDGDGDTDYVISDRGSGSDTGQLYWIQRQDNGDFVKWTIEAGADFQQADVADFDGDGDDDVVAVGFSQTTVNLYLNDGNLNFAKEEIADEVTQSTLVEAEDIDADDDVDIVFGGGDAQILWNNGDATFAPGPQLFTWDDFAPSSSFGLAVADLNDDDVLDILTFSGRGSGGLYLLDGAENFNQSLVNAIGIDLGGDLVVADFDENGLQDIVRQEQGDNLLSILYQDGPMEFRSVVLEYNWDNRGPSQMAVGDMDDDGDVDLVFPENGNVDGDISWFENIDGSLHRHQLHVELKGVRAPRIVDLDGDDDLDVVAAVTDDISIEDEIIWFENRGENGFIEWRITDSLNYPVDVEVIDLNGDGQLDAVASARDDNDLVWFERSGVTWEPFKIEDNANEPLGLTALDVDADGDNDVALTSSADDKVYWYMNDGAGSFTRQIIDANLPDPLEIEAADLDEDGDVDFVVLATNADNPIVTYLNDGDENFAREIFPSDVVQSDVEIADWNGDDTADILISSEQNSPVDPDVMLLANDGDAAFTSDTLLSDNRNVTALRAADVDDDGDVDLIVGNDNVVPRMRVYINEQGEASTSIDLLADVTASISGIDAGDLNGDGMMDFVAADIERSNLMMFLGSEGSPIAVDPISREIPSDFSLEQNYPNPFNPITTIAINLAEPSHVILKIYDMQGREVATLLSGTLAAGRYETQWDAAGFANGTYLYRMQAESHSDAKLLTLMK